jgi:hypothetical protein
LAPRRAAAMLQSAIIIPNTVSLYKLITKYYPRKYNFYLFK